MRHLSVNEVVERLDELEGRDYEADHAAADELLLGQVHSNIKEAYERLVRRAGLWPTA